MFLLGPNPISDGWPAAGLRFAPRETPPVRVSGPTIVGTLKVGETLHLDPLPVYSGNPEPTVTWLWQGQDPADESVLDLQTGGALVLTEAHLGFPLRVQDKGTNSVGEDGYYAGAWTAPVEPADEPAVEP